MSDDVIERLIKPPRKIFVGFDWSNTEKLKPTGDAEKHKILGERFAPKTPARDDA